MMRLRIRGGRRHHTKPKKTRERPALPPSSEGQISFFSKKVKVLSEGKRTYSEKTKGQIERGGCDSEL